MTVYAAELAFAREVAQLGGSIAMEHYGTGMERKQKHDGSWVTEADRKVEAQIRLRIARTWPEHNTLGEEEGLTAADGGTPFADAPTWVIDPIDGTHNYMSGVPIWATLVALRVDEVSVVGVVHAPALDETYEAVLGGGARCNGTAISVDGCNTLADATVLYGGDHAFFESGLADFHRGLITRSWRARGFGDFWGHMLVARGAGHVMVEPMVSIWDVAALEPIVTEAGGRISHLDGSKWQEQGSCLSTNGVLHDEVVDLARRTSGSATERGVR